MPDDGALTAVVSCDGAHSMTYYIWAYLDGRWSFLAEVEGADSFEEACYERFKHSRWFRASDNTYWSATMRQGCSPDEYQRRVAAVSPINSGA